MGLYGDSDRPCGAATNGDPAWGTMPTYTTVWGSRPDNEISWHERPENKYRFSADHWGRYAGAGAGVAAAGAGGISATGLFVILFVIVVFAVFNPGNQAIHNKLTETSEKPGAQSSVMLEPQPLPTPISIQYNDVPHEPEKVAQLQTYHVIAEIESANVRHAPTTESDLLIYGIQPGTPITCDAIVEGQEIDGDSRWARCPETHGYIFLGLLEPQP